MGYIRDQFHGHRAMVDEYSTGTDEPATIERPPQAGVINNRITIEGTFRPSEAVDDNLTATGITSRLNGAFFIREAFIPPELGEVVRPGTMEMSPGWSLTVRGVRMRVTRMVLEFGELAVMLSDVLEEHGERY